MLTNIVFTIFRREIPQPASDPEPDNGPRSLTRSPTPTVEDPEDVYVTLPLVPGVKFASAVKARESEYNSAVHALFGRAIAEFLYSMVRKNMIPLEEQRVHMVIQAWEQAIGELGEVEYELPERVVKMVSHQ